MKRFLLCALALALVPAASNVAACNGEITELIVEDGSPGGQGFYIDDRSGGNAELDHWVYQETNGQDGLQSGFHTEFPVWPVTYNDDCWTDPFGTPDWMIL